MKSINIALSLVALLLGAFIIVRAMDKKHTATKNIASNKGFAVVELFTSEGCSSCPPADEALADIVKHYQQNVFPLEFHVDYWNQLGWKDEFSKAAYSDRQRNYASIFNKDGVYTPQAIVNGTIQFIGSDAGQLSSAINNGLEGDANAAPVISIAAIKNNTVDIAYTLQESSAGAVLNIALVQLHAVTNVKRGENGGRKLSHVNVVRDFKTVARENATGKISLTIPPELSAGECKIIAYTQSISSLKIIGAVALDIR